MDQQAHRSRPILLIGAVTVALYACNDGITRALFRDTLSPAWGMSAYVLITLALFLAYGLVLALCSRGELGAGPARAWALCLPCIMNAVLVVTVPSMSADIFSYMAQGTLGITPGDNPLLQPAEQAAQTLIGGPLARAGWHGEIGITPYGIVWTQIEIAVMTVCGTHISAALVVLKSVVVALSLATAYGIWTFLGFARPAAQLFGTLAYLWNPLIVIEFAGEGHNDAVMLCFVMAALAACAASRPTASMVAQGLAAATKYVPVIFLPAQLVYLWRQRQSTGRLALHVIAASALTGILVAILYAPLWAGWHSFDGVLRRAQPLSSASPFGGINWMLRRSPWAAFASSLTLLAVTLPLAAWIAWISLRVGNVMELARAFAWISLGYVLFAAPDYWPWYACLPVALILAADMKNLLWLVMLLSFTARICAPLDLLRAHGYLTMVVAKGALTGLGASLPLAALLVWFVRQRHRASASLHV